jgi:Chaperone of endosialidase
MKNPIQFKSFGLWPARADRGRQAPVACCFTLAFVLLASTARAVSPAPDGGYPNGNTAEGNWALFSLTNGAWNTALGQQTLYHDTSGFSNTALGFGALFGNATAVQNTATGVYALFSNTTGSNNTATGYQTLANNTAGFRNAAVGAYALFSHASGNYNNAVGAFALYADTIGIANNAFGESALPKNTSGRDNTAIGDDALWGNTTGSFNIALGSGAGRFLTTGSHNIDIGNLGVAGESNTIRIGNQGTQTGAFIAGIWGTAVKGSAVVVNSSGQLGVAASSARYKDEIKPMDKASEAILALKPVTFRYKKEIDPDSTAQFGLVAEDVAKVSPDLVVYNGKGEIYTVRYDAVNAMLLNEFLKEHKKVQDLEAIVASLVATVKEQATEIQKVSAQVEMNKFATGRIRRGGPTTKVVVNRP